MKINLISIGKYIIHALLASYGIMVFGFVVEGLLPNRRKIDYFFVGPTFLFPIIVGLALGFLFGSKLPAVLRRCLFILPLAMLLWEIWGFIHNNNDVTWRNFFNNFLGTNCTSSECLGELVLTSPLISSLAYTVGAEIARLRPTFSTKRNSLQKVT